MATLKILSVVLMFVAYAAASHPSPFFQAPFYRYWNARIGDHFYTTNYKELGAGKHGWKAEGTQCKILKYHQPGSVALYRYWSGRDHFYTTNVHEIGTSTPGVRRKGYTSEGVAGFCYPTHRNGLIPLYRYWKAANTDHFYTTNINEIGTATRNHVGRYGYKSEGVTCYVYPA